MTALLSVNAPADMFMKRLQKRKEDLKHESSSQGVTIMMLETQPISREHVTVKDLEDQEVQGERTLHNQSQQRLISHRQAFSRRNFQYCRLFLRISTDL